MAQAYQKRFFNTYYQGKDLIGDADISDRILESFRDNYLKLLPADKTIKILDVGCGAGHFLYFLKKSGYENIEGIDIGQEQVAACKKLGVNASLADDPLSFLSSRAGAYDLIILNFVIEHVRKDDILPFMNAAGGALKAGGKMIVATENMARLSGLWTRYSDVTHEVGYTENSMNHLLYTAGLKNIKIYGMETKFHLRVKNICWLIALKAWQAVLGFIYLLEMGTDRPKILAKNLLCVASKTSG